LLARLTRAKRSRAGKILAFVYVLCVLAPAVAFAFSDPCLTDSGHGMGNIHAHEAIEQVHADHHPHQRSESVQAGGEHDSHFRVAQPDTDDRASAGNHCKSNDSHCCGTICVNALPATVAELTEPSVLISRCLAVNYQQVADNASPTLYRPPIL